MPETTAGRSRRPRRSLHRRRLPSHAVVGRLLREGVECLLSGDLDTGKALVRDYINATIGFEKLSDMTDTPSKSLMRMLGPKGNPQARNLLEIIGHLQRTEGLQFELSVKR